MSSLFNNIIIFSLGAAVGSLVTCRLIYNKAFDKASEEIDAKWRERYTESVNEVSEPQSVEGQNETVEEKEDDEKEDDIPGPTEEAHAEEIWYDPYEEKNKIFEKVEDIIKREGYNEDTIKDKESEKNMEMIMDPYVIVPEAFEDYYDGMTLLYHTDGIVTDLRHNIISNYEELIGVGGFQHFDEFEDPDAAYFRNDRLAMDYEVLRENISYASLELDK